MPRSVIAALVGLTVGALFIASNTAALHRPQPHRAEVDLVGAGSAAAEAQRKLDLSQPDRWTVRTVGSIDAGERRVLRREAFGALDPQSGVAVYAGANGRAAERAVVQTLQAMATARGTTAALRDVAPPPPGDTSGLTGAQVALGTILGGFIMSLFISQIALGEPTAVRLGAIVGGAIALGGLAAVILDPWLDAYTGEFWTIWFWVGAGALAVALGVAALGRALGPYGLGLAALTMLIVGNPSAGAAAPAQFLPWLHRTLGPYLPPNASATGLIDDIAFPAAGLNRPLIVLAAWALTGAAVLIALGPAQPLAEKLAAAAD